jgi:hypothetical protein
MVHTKARQVHISTRQGAVGHHRYPIPEAHIGDASCQPWVHDCVVTVQEGCHKYRFAVFFKRHCRLAPNKCLKELLHRTPRLQSDAVVMRLGKGKHAYLNMRERDTLLADWVMKRYVIDNATVFFHVLILF